MNILLFLVFVFGALGIAITHSALKTQGNVSEFDNKDGSLHERISRIEAVMLADDTVSKRLSDLEKEIKRVGEENNQLRDVIEKQDSTIKQLAVEVEKLQSDNVRLGWICKEALANIVSTEEDETRIPNLDQNHPRRNHTTRDNLQMVKNNARRTEGTYDNFSPTSHVTKRGNYLGNNGFIPQRHIRQTQGGQLAFYSTVSVSDITSLGVQQPIIFDRVITNIGGAYHPNTGVFITPADGVYVFNFGAMSCGRKAENLELVKDGYGIQSVYADAPCDSCDSCASDSLVSVLELCKGNEVWVRTTYGSGQIHGNSYTFFSGWLLFMKECA